MKLMCSTAQCFELLARAGAVAGLGEPPLAERQCLVGAQHQPTRTASSDRTRLFARQQRREFARIARRATLLDPPLVDIRGLDLDRNPGIAQEGTARSEERRVGKECGDEWRWCR